MGCCFSKIPHNEDLKTSLNPEKKFPPKVPVKSSIEEEKTIKTPKTPKCGADSFQNSNSDNATTVKFKKINGADSFDKEIKKLTQDSENHKKALQEALFEIDLLKGRNKDYQVEVEKLKAAIQSLEAEKDKKSDLYKKEIERSANENSSKVTQMNIKIKEFEEEMATKENDIAGKDRKLAKHKKQIEELLAELTEKTEKIESLERKYEALQKKLDKSQENLETTSQKLEITRSKNKKLKFEKTAAEEEATNLKNQLVSSKIKTSKNGKMTSEKSKKTSDKYSYDIVVNIDSLRSHEIGWKITKSEYLQKSISPKESYSIIGLVGRENIGKTYVLNKICDLDLPSGTNVNTEGLSLKYASKRNLICLDSAGVGIPVYYFDELLLQRFSTKKEEVKQNASLRLQMIDDRTLTDVFIQDFILEVCEVIIIVVGQLSQFDQKLIERVTRRYQAKKRIIIVHNFANLPRKEDVEQRSQKDISNVYETITRYIPGSDVNEYIEKIGEKNRENISHLVLGVESCESGDFFNDPTLNYLKDILDTRVEKKRFNLVKELTKYMEENYRLYFQFRKRPKSNFTLRLNEDENELFINTDGEFEVSNPIFNSLGNLVTNPPFEVLEKESKYICLIELSDLKIKTLELSIDKKGPIACLIIKARKSTSQKLNEGSLKAVGTRNNGEITCKIPIGPRECRLQILNNEVKYEKGVLVVEIDKIAETEENF